MNVDFTEVKTGADLGIRWASSRWKMSPEGTGVLDGTPERTGILEGTRRNE